MVHPTDEAPEGKPQVIAVHGSGHELQRIRRELDEGLGLRHVLVAQGDKAVVGRNEQIVARDVRLVVERWPMGFHLLRQVIPEQLCLVRDGPPRGHGPLMHACLDHLAGSPPEDRLALLPGIALPIPMIPGSITGRAEAVAEKYVWVVPGHPAAVTLGLNNNKVGPSRLHKYSKNQRLKQA